MTRTRARALLKAQGRVEELRAEVDAGRPGVAERLIELLVEQGEAEQADRLRRFGLNPDGSIAADAPDVPLPTEAALVGERRQPVLLLLGNLAARRARLR